MFQFPFKKQSDGPTLGLYIHIPFCVRKCAYCDFYSIPGRESQMDEYLKALSFHLEETAPQAEGYRVDTIYFGGGTPSYFGGERIAAILKTIRRRYRVTRDCEITVECNPDTTTPELLKTLRKAGVNRLSFGVQSACDEELRQVGRLHSYAQAEQAFRMAREAEFDNLSLDLIYGLPGQSIASWQQSVETLIALNPEHLSCYGLKLEEGTPLYEHQAQYTMADDDTQADMYLWMVERLKQAGFDQYEISNFAKPGKESRHNLKYWLGQEYIGFGPGAHSCFGARRYGCVRDLDAYNKGVLHGGAILSESSEISRQEQCKEYIMLRMRTTRGISAEEYAAFYQDFAPLEERLEEYQSYGWAEQTDGRWHFTPSGFLLSTPLISDLLIIQEEAAEKAVRPLKRKRMQTDQAFHAKRRKRRFPGTEEA